MIVNCQDVPTRSNGLASVHSLAPEFLVSLERQGGTAIDRHSVKLEPIRVEEDIVDGGVHDDCDCHRTAKGQRVGIGR